MESPRGRAAWRINVRRLLGVLLLVAGVAGAVTAVAVVGHALVAPAPVGILPLVERAARAEAAIAVVGHALSVGLLGSGGRRGDAQRRGRQQSRKAREG